MTSPETRRTPWRPIRKRSCSTRDEVWDAVRDSGALHTHGSAPGSNHRYPPRRRRASSPSAAGWSCAVIVDRRSGAATRLVSARGRLTHHSTSSAQVFAERGPSSAPSSSGRPTSCPDELAGDIRAMTGQGAAAMHEGLREADDASARRRRARVEPYTGRSNAALARLVEVVRQDPLAGAPKAHPFVGRCAWVESGVRPGGSGA